jgi:hypothetical protein
MPRYVILWHELPETHEVGAARESHWDLMLEWGDVLRTWALASEPAVGDSGKTEALPDHRRSYLDYEGPVSGNRGHVTRWDFGEYEIASESDSQLLLTLRGERLSAHVTLEKGDGSHFWRVSFSELPTRG